MKLISSSSGLPVDPNNPPIDLFDGKYEWLSNFHTVSFTWDGVVWPCSENAYQAAKSDDPACRELMARHDTRPGHAKKMSKTFSRRADWDAMKIAVMTNIVEAKFRTPYLRAALLETGDREIIEGNWWGDVFWGACNGKGRNELGKILMALRASIRAEL